MNKTIDYETSRGILTEKSIPYLMGAILIMTFVIILLLAMVSTTKDEMNSLEKENKELKQNQKPATELYNESNKPCAGC